MIHPVLKFLGEQLNSYIEQVKKPGDGIESPCVMLQNISRLDEDALKNTNKVLLTLVNLSEETSMRNNPGQVVRNNTAVDYRNPPVNLNLFLLFTACMTNYENALIYLSHTITFFQGKSNFNKQNSPTTDENLPDDLYIILELNPLSFEQLNYVWSTLGGKQHPFVCYKARLLKIERESTREVRGVIREIQVDDKAIQPQ